MKTFWAPRAWVDAGWRDAVLLCVGADGHWLRIEPDVATPPPDATVLAGPVLPGLVDAHSHAFQRAFAGLAERRADEEDDFWSWRDRMYGLALRITPAQLRVVAAQLCVELLRGGYTQLCEFHYLQHQPDGSPYEDPLALGWAVSDAAAEAGIGLTLLPVLYCRAGFGVSGLRDEQRRFRSSPAGVWEASRRFASAGRALQGAGLAIHSLRAAAAGDIAALLALAGDADIPIHIHVAEQRRELQECEATTGLSPIAWLARQGWLDPRWQLVHATHASTAEIAQVAERGAGVVLCPGTEANLGDGFCNLRALLDAGVALGIGSDSHVTRGWVEELRWLEYGQRLRTERRNVAAAPYREPSTAARLFDTARAAGAAAAGFPCWGLQPGARADFLVLDTACSGLHGVPLGHTLDALVFATQGGAIRDVFVAGQQRIARGRHAREEEIAQAFAAVMAQLWEQAPG